MEILAAVGTIFTALVGALCYVLIWAFVLLFLACVFFVSVTFGLGYLALQALEQNFQQVDPTTPKPNEDIVRRKNGESEFTSEDVQRAAAAGNAAYQHYVETGSLPTEKHK